MRVARETFNELASDPTYRCTSKSITNNVCVCPHGFGDFECSTSLYKKCFLNITEPALFEGCSDREDTPHYLYSVPGYDPCFPLNFTRSHEIKFKVQCSALDANGLAQSQEAPGYDYRDVTKSPEYNPFSYVATNPETQFSILEHQEYVVQFELRDFKYLSNVYKAQVRISDPLVMAGQKSAAVEIDFGALLESDEAGLSRFVVGGRVYFEANLFGYQTSSFTTKGFFDQLGYEEPMQAYIYPEDPQRFWKLLQQWMPVLGTLLALRIIVALRDYMRRMEGGAAVVPGEKLHKD